MQSKKRILCIWYDYSHLVAHKLFLEAAGFAVTPALGFGEALERCAYDHAFDLVVMGDSMPRSDKKVLISARLRSDGPVLSVRKHDDKPLPEAEFSVDSKDGVGALITAIKSALGLSRASELGTPIPTA